MIGDSKSGGFAMSGFFWFSIERKGDAHNPRRPQNLNHSDQRIRSSAQCIERLALTHHDANRVGYEQKSSAIVAGGRPTGGVMTTDGMLET